MRAAGAHVQLAKHDTYGRISYGNVQLYTAPSTRKTADEERKAAERYARVRGEERGRRTCCKKRPRLWLTHCVRAFW